MGKQEEVRAVIERLVARIRTTRNPAWYCPRCGAFILRRVQEGAEVFADPCGHLLYQGSRHLW